MDIISVRKCAEEMLRQIEANGLASIFDTYNKDDIEANYLKCKIIGQLHIYDEHAGRYDDDVIKSYVKAEPERIKLIRTKTEIDEDRLVYEFSKTNSKEFSQISEYYFYQDILNFLTNIDDEYIYSFINNYGAKKPEKPKSKYYEDKENYKKEIERYKEQKYAFKEFKKQLPSLIEKVKAILVDIDIDKITKDHPKETELIKIQAKHRADIYLSGVHEYKDENDKIYRKLDQNQTFNLQFLQKIISKSPADDVEYYTEERLKEYDDAVKITKIILKLFTLDKTVNVEKFISSIRNNFLSGDDLNFRKYNIFGGGLGNTDWTDTTIDVKEISEHYQKFIAKANQLLNNNLTEEELLRAVAKLQIEFVYIHPYQDGNGRTSRMLMDYLLISNGFIPPVYSLGFESKREYNSKVYKSLKNKDTKFFEDWLIEKYNIQIKKDLQTNV